MFSYRTVRLNVVYHLLESVREFLEIFLIKEDLMLVVCETAVFFYPAFAFSDGKIIVIPSGSLYVEELGALPGSDLLGIYIVTTLLSIGFIKILAVHCKFF